MQYNKQDLLQKFVEICVKSDDEFLIIRETLTRIGISVGNELRQQFHIFHKQGKYYIVHYRHMLAFNGQDVEILPEDWANALLVATMLCTWNLTTMKSVVPTAAIRGTTLTVVQSKDRHRWVLRPMYRIGQR